jgi:transposase, IS5 family
VFHAERPGDGRSAARQPLFRDFAGLGGWDDRLPDESTILRFRHGLEKHKLAERILALVNLLLGARRLMLRSGTVVDPKLT